MPQGTPINSVPDEILIEFLLAVLDRSPGGWPDCATLSQTMTPLRLVCTRWNNVITSTPEFWDTIHFDLPAETESDSEDDDDSSVIHLRTPDPWVLKLWIQRSAEVPLETVCHTPIWSYWEEATSLALDIILSSAHCWRYARISLGTNAVERIFTTKNDKPPPPNALEELSLSFFTHKDEDVELITPVLEYFGSSSHLYAFTFDFNFCDSSAKMIELAESCMPLHQLTKLQFSFINTPLDRILAFCSACPSLMWLTFDDSNAVFGSPAIAHSEVSTYRGRFPELRILKLVNLIERKMLEYFITVSLLLLECPKLEVLYVEGRNSVPDCVTHISSMISRCGFTHLHALFIKLRGSNHSPIVEIDPCVLDESRITRIPILKLSCYMSNLHEEAVALRVQQELTEYAKNRPGTRIQVNKGAATVGWGDYSAAPRMVKTFLKGGSVNPRHIVLGDP